MKKAPGNQDRKLEAAFLAVAVITVVAAALVIVSQVAAAAPPRGAQEARAQGFVDQLSRTMDTATVYFGDDRALCNSLVCVVPVEFPTWSDALAEAEALGAMAPAGCRVAMSLAGPAEPGAPYATTLRMGCGL